MHGIAGLSWTPHIRTKQRHFRVFLPRARVLHYFAPTLLLLLKQEGDVDLYGAVRGGIVADFKGVADVDGAATLTAQQTANDRR